MVFKLVGRNPPVESEAGHSPLSDGCVGTAETMARQQQDVGILREISQECAFYICGQEVGGCIVFDCPVLSYHI